MPPRRRTVRTNQRLRTRKDLLHAAGRLMRAGRTPTMDEVAEEAMVSRATAYRYFPTVEALLVEAPLDVAVADPAEFFVGDGSTDPEERLIRAEAMLHEVSWRNEAQLRASMVHALRQSLARGKRSVPVRQNRRTPLIEAALAPVREEIDDATWSRLTASLALVFGTESMLVFRDVLPLPESEAQDVKRWAVKALVRAALAKK